MAIRKSKTRTNITIAIKLKEQLQEMAKEDDRSFNSLVIEALEQYVEKRTNK